MAEAKSTPDRLSKHLFPEDGRKLFVILDGASVPDLLDELYGEEAPEFKCLQRGELEPDLAEVAPYLVLLSRDSKFTEWVIREGWGKHWGIFAVAELNLKGMFNHFRSLLTHYDAEGKPLLFRYYDPRVMREYLQTCDATELKRVFGPVESIVVESEDATSALRFKNDDGALSQEPLLLK